MADLKGIAADLRVELDELDELVSGLTEEQWKTSTPAKPWTVRDQIAHLAFFDDQAVLALMNPEAFATSLEQIAADVGAFMNRSVVRAQSMPGREVLGWWRESRAAVFDAIETLPADQRIPWYGPPMKPTSFLSARLMEAFAHGHDITDGLGTRRAPTDRLRHVAHIGVRAREYAYMANGLPAPMEEVRVELVAPSGEAWTWDEDAKESVTGSGYDFCLVVTRRRHVADTALVCSGPNAERWMSIAQAYAGPPGEGRSPGQFTSVEN
jgi:uncharacterized protein (TIGR03084 family)